MSIHREAHKGDALALVLHQRLRGERAEALPRVGAEDAIQQRKDKIRQYESHEHRARGCRSEDAERPCRRVARSRLLDGEKQRRHHEESLADDQWRHEAGSSAVPERRLGGEGGADRSEHVLRSTLDVTDGLSTQPQADDARHAARPTREVCEGEV